MLDFVERYFGISPDNGDGTIEGLIIVAAIIIIVFLAMLWLDPRKSKQTNAN